MKKMLEKEILKTDFPATIFLAVIIIFLTVAFGLTGIASGQGGEGKLPPQEAPKSRAAQAEKMSLEDIAEARKLLEAMGYWLNPDAVAWDVTIKHALIAFQKVEGRDPKGVLTREELEALRQAMAPVPLELGYPHIEVDLARQVLFLVGFEEETQRILPVSTGNGEPYEYNGNHGIAVTPVGRYKINRKIPGRRKSPLGILYYPGYFLGGIAIHGNASVPVTPASHGCIRIPMFAAKEFYELTPIGMEVLIY